MAMKEEKENNDKKLKKTLNIMIEHGRVEETNCDLIMHQYSRLCEKIQENEEIREAFCDFDTGKNRLDTLFHSVLKEKHQLQDLWGVVKQLLLLSHGQASVERGFSINREVTDDNLKKNSLIARRHIVEVCQQYGGPEYVPITKELLVTASSSRSQYFQHLAEEKKDDAAERGAKRKTAMDEIKGLKVKKTRVETDITTLLVKADRLCEEAEEKGCLRFVTEANALRSKAKEKRASLAPLQQQIEEAQGRLKELE